MWWDFENRKVYGRQSWFKRHEFGIWCVLCAVVIIAGTVLGFIMKD